MKKSINIVIMLFFIIPIMRSQNKLNTQLFVIYTTTGTQKRVLNIDKNNNKLIFINKSISDTDTYFDGFIIKPVSKSTHRVYIIPAKENNLFLKRKGDLLELSDINQDQDKTSYEWEIQYTGHPYITISEPLNHKKVIAMRLGEVKMLDVNNIRLSNNNDTQGDDYRFTISRIRDTF